MSISLGYYQVVLLFLQALQTVQGMKMPLSSDLEGMSISLLLLFIITINKD
jgi:hypothetical protein